MGATRVVAEADEVSGAAGNAGPLRGPDRHAEICVGPGPDPGLAPGRYLT
jgi:hypothetical protein